MSWIETMEFEKSDETLTISGRDWKSLVAL
jgi:hypothetical protein